MGSMQDEGMIIFHTVGPCIVEAIGMQGIKPTALVIETHPISVNKVNPIVNLIISICIIIALLFLLVFISLALLVNVIVPCLSSSIFALDVIHIYGLLIVLLNILQILLVWETTDAMAGCIIIETRIKAHGSNIERTWCVKGVIVSVR